MTIPTEKEVSPANLRLLDQLKEQLGFVPNAYAAMANSEFSLEAYLKLQDTHTAFKALEKVVVNLVVSCINESDYCIWQHSREAGRCGLTPEQITEIRMNKASFDPKLGALVALTVDLVQCKGRPRAESLADFYKAGFNFGHLVDLNVLIGAKSIMNYICNIVKPPIDFPNDFPTQS